MMRDFDLPPAEIEEKAKVLDPDAWCSSDTQGGAFELRYRRYRAREAAGWPNEHHPPLKLTRGERQMLELAQRSSDGNPWPLIGMQARTGGAKSRMFDSMKARGLFNDSNCMTGTARSLLGQL